MWHALIAFSKYCLKAKSKHRIHSPFVYNLITKALEKPIEKKNLNKYFNYKKDLLADDDIIEATDFGTGSKTFKSNKRNVSQITKKTEISLKKTKLLLKLSSYFKPKNILELGTSLGLDTTALNIGAPTAKITTIESCKNTSEKAKFHLTKHQFKNIEIQTGSFDVLLPKVLKQQKFDLIYFNGNPQKNATFGYFMNSLQSVHNDTLCIFDAIHREKEMEEAWEYIKKHPKTKVSIDLFDIGLVFFRKEQVKQDFIIKLKK